jgi:multiple sugar transport system permease protein
MFYILISPFIAMLFLMKLFPFIWGVVMSFTNFTGFNYDNLKFIGFHNYERVVTDNFVIQSLQATAVIGLITVPMGLFISFALALLLNSAKKGVGIFRTVYYFPSIIPVVATGLMWRVLFNNDGGAFNELLSVFGFAPINWLGMDWCRQSLIIFMAWSSGGGILTYLAALKSVPKELYESASIDGANGLQKLLKITIPVLTPVIFFNLVNGLIAAWQIFGQPIFLAANAGSLLSVPYKPNYVYLVHVYQQIFVNQRFGYGLSMIWMLFIFSIVCTRVIFYTSKYWVFYENESGGDRVKKKKPSAKQKGVSPVV